MTPEDVAADDYAWDHYLYWLTHFGVAQDRVEVLAHPGARKQLTETPAHLDPRVDLSELADGEAVPPTAWLRAEELPEAQRALVAAWTWPDRTFTVHDAFEKCVLQRIESVADDEARAVALSMIVGSELMLRMILVGEATGHSYSDIRTHLAASPVGDNHLESLLAGLCRVDIATLLTVSERLGLSFREHWRIEDPFRVAADIQRSVEVARLTETCENLSADSLVELNARAVAMSSANPDADIRPDQFHDKLLRAVDGPRPRTVGRWRNNRTSFGKYEPLYRALDSDKRHAPTYSLDDIDSLLRDASRSDRRSKVGLPEMAREQSFWWSNGSATKNTQVRAWKGAGYRVKSVDLEAGLVQFEAEQGRGRWWEVREALRAGTYKAPAVGAQDLPSPKLLQARFVWATRAGVVGLKLIESDYFAFLGSRRLMLRTNPGKDGTPWDLVHPAPPTPADSTTDS